MFLYQIHRLRPQHIDKLINIVIIRAQYQHLMKLASLLATGTSSFNYVSWVKLASDTDQISFFK